MSLIAFILDIYFAATLGIAGLAKLDRPASFSSALRYRYHFPKWSIGAFSRVFPFIEILLSLALLLTTYTAKTAVTIAVLGLFFVFFALHGVDHVTRKVTDTCGCYGKTLQRNGIQMNVATLFIQLVMAAFLVFLTLVLSPLAYIYYIVSAVLFTGVYGWLGWNLWRRHRLNRRIHVLSSPSTHEQTHEV